MTYCTKCGSVNPDGAVYCIRCGIQLSSTQNMSHPQSVPDKSVINNYYCGRLRRRDRRRLAFEGQGSPASIVAEKDVIKEIVLVPCAYCGSLMPSTSIACPNCGAKRKA